MVEGRTYHGQVPCAVCVEPPAGGAREGHSRALAGMPGECPACSSVATALGDCERASADVGSLALPARERRGKVVVAGIRGRRVVIVLVIFVFFVFFVIGAGRDRDGLEVLEPPLGRLETPACVGDFDGFAWLLVMLALFGLPAGREDEYSRRARQTTTRHHLADAQCRASSGSRACGSRRRGHSGWQESDDFPGRCGGAGTRSRNSIRADSDPSESSGFSWMRKVACKRGTAHMGKREPWSVKGGGGGGGSVDRGEGGDKRSRSRWWWWWS